MAHWASILLGNESIPPNPINNKAIRVQQHIIPGHEELMLEKRQKSNVICRNDTRKSRETTHRTVVSYADAPHRKTHSGVRGVTVARFPDGKILWLARIQHNNVMHLLYCGASMDEAIQARKEAEIHYKTYTISSVKASKKDILPHGVCCVIKNNKPYYQSRAYLHKSVLNLYNGYSLEAAIEARRTWEKEHGFKNMNGSRCYTKKSGSPSASGVTGVWCSKGKYWIASAVKGGMKYTLYHGNSMEMAIQARKRWEKDNTCVQASHIPGGSHRAAAIMKLFKSHKKLTSIVVAQALSYSIKNASAQLSRMYHNGYLIRLNGGPCHSYIYMKNLDRDNAEC